MFIALAGSELSLGTGVRAAASPPVPSDDLFVSPTFVQTLVAELAAAAMFRPTVRCAAAALGKLVDRLGSPIVGPTHALKGETFLVRCGLLYRRGQREADRLCIPAGGGLRAQVLRKYHDGPHFRGAKTGPLVRRLAFWVGQETDVAENVCSFQTCQRTKAGTAARAGSSTPCRCRQGAAG